MGRDKARLIVKQRRAAAKELGKRFDATLNVLCSAILDGDGDKALFAQKVDEFAASIEELM